MSPPKRPTTPARQSAGPIDELKEFVRDVVHGTVTRIAIVLAVLILSVVAVIAFAVVLVAG